MEIKQRRVEQLKKFTDEELAARLYQLNPFGGYRVKKIANLRNGILSSEMAICTIIRYEFGPDDGVKK